MSNRYNELNESTQHMIDQLVNSMASNRHIEDEVMIETLMNALANIRQLGRESMEVS
jgi:hypothetical protein